MLRAILQVSMPKFTKEDAPLFIGIVSDLFPDHQALIRRYYDLGLGGGSAMPGLGDTSVDHSASSAPVL